MLEVVLKSDQPCLEWGRHQLVRLWLSRRLPNLDCHRSPSRRAQPPGYDFWWSPASHHRSHAAPSAKDERESCQEFQVARVDPTQVTSWRKTLRNLDRGKSGVKRSINCCAHGSTKLVRRQKCMMLTFSLHRHTKQFCTSTWESFPIWLHMVNKPATVFLRFVEERNYPMAFGCIAGKDRTGTNWDCSRGRSVWLLSIGGLLGLVPWVWLTFVEN